MDPLISPDRNRNPNAMSELHGQSAAAGDAADNARQDNVSSQQLLTFMTNQQTKMAQQNKTLEAISTATTSMTALLSAAQPNVTGTGPANNPQPTQPVPTKMPDLATARRPDNCHSSIPVSTPYSLADLHLDDQETNLATAQRPDNCHSSITVSTLCLADLQLDNQDA